MYTIKSKVSKKSQALGATLFPTGDGASFRVWAHNASVVQVILAPADGAATTTLPLGQDTTAGYWSADIDGVLAGHPYQFSITNKGGDTYDPGGLPLLRVDPCARGVTSPDAKKPGLVIDPTSYTFQNPFPTPSFEKFIIYQLHVGSFAGRNDGIVTAEDANGCTARFDQVQTKLQYIQQMNFNAVQFLPTGEYRGSEGEAYNPTNYYAPELLYGSPDDLRRLIDACHGLGLAVFFDVVYNHMDTTDNLWQFDGNNDNRTDESDPQTGGGIYFSKIDTGFGRRPNHDSPDVQRFFIDNATMWFEEYHVDGLRFDSAVNFSEGGLKAIAGQLLQNFPDKFIYAEDSDPNYIFGDIGFRACWDMGSADGFAQVIVNRDLAGLQNLIGRFGYPAAYSAIKYLLGSHDQIFNQWESSDGRTWYWDKPAHDGLRENRYFVEKIGGPVTGRQNWYALAQARMGWAVNIAMPCTPMLFMGSEFHLYGYWNPSLDPFGDHRVDWSIAGDQTGSAMRALVTYANTLRSSNPALVSDNPPDFPHVDQLNNVLAFRRWNDNGNVVLVVVNLSDNQWGDFTYGVATGVGGSWSEIFNSQSPQYGGWQDSGNYGSDLNDAGDGKIYIRLPKWSVLIFQQTG